jgi:DNA-binding LytR/AlgR family response regulator
MENIRIVIVDDEPIAHNILVQYISKVPGLTLAGQCKNALEAFSFLSKNKVEIMLLDINMPEISGLDLLQTIKNPPLVIFTTAYAEFAVKSYELNAVDYLLKPFSFERFLKAINKATDILQTTATDLPAQNTSTETRPDANVIFVKSEGKLVKVDLHELWLIEGLKDYVKLWTLTGKIVIHSTMKNIEDQLNKTPDFVRVNKSFIINTKYISSIDGNCIVIKDQKIPVGSTYRDVIQKLLQNYRLI